MLVSLVASTAGLSLWNYYDVSLPLPDPASDISQVQEWQYRDSATPPSGRTLWSYESASAVNARPTFAAGGVYVVEGRMPNTGRIVALGDSNGSITWSRRLDDVSVHSPVVAGDLLFVGARSGRLMAMDRSTGTPVWEIDLGSSIVGAPIVRDGVIYAASDSVHALDAQTGEERWRHELGGTVARGLTLSDGVVGAIGSDGEVYLINASNGSRRLTFPLWFATSAPPVASEGLLIISGSGPKVQALALSARDVPMEKAMRYWWSNLWLWHMAPIPPLPRGYAWQHRGRGGLYSDPLGADTKRVYLAISERDVTGRVLALGLKGGEPLWERRFESRVTSPAFLTARGLVVGTERGTIVALDKLSGAVQWQYDVGGGFAAAPVAGPRGMILISTVDGRLRALR